MPALAGPRAAAGDPASPAGLAIAGPAALPIAAPADVGLCAMRLRRIETVFAAEVVAGRLPGGVVMLARHGQLACSAAFGCADPVTRTPMPTDALFRIFSMTKPLTSVAALLLCEQGRLQLADPVARYLPAFADMRVCVPAPGDHRAFGHLLVPAARPITVHDLMIHTSGLVYGARCTNRPVHEAYARLGIPLNPRDIDAPDFIGRIAAAPLAHQPGTVWEYGASTDVLGVLIEAITGQRLGEFLADQVFKPLHMIDTGFDLPPALAHRLAQPFGQDPVDGTSFDRPNQTYDASIPARLHAGGAGALSTAGDYLCFAQMLLAGGTLDGVRILSRKSVRWMTADHLGQRIAAPITPGDAAIQSPGYGFGLGLAVRLHDGQANVPGSSGSSFWSGTAGTLFWLDPQEDLVAVYMTQAPGASRQHYRRLIMQLAYQAIDD